MSKKKKSEEDLVEGLASGELTLNDVRKEMGLPDLPGGDVSLTPKPLLQMITFDRYFLSLGRPMHHKAGMMAYRNTKGKKTVEAWDALFKGY